MRIKHWHGYGKVNVTTVVRTETLCVLRVSGNHERGLEINQGDKYTLAHWLGKRGKFTEDMVESYETNEEFLNGEDVCTYIIHFKML